MDANCLGYITFMSSRLQTSVLKRHTGVDKARTMPPISKLHISKDCMSHNVLSCRKKCLSEALRKVRGSMVNPTMAMNIILT